MTDESKKAIESILDGLVVVLPLIPESGTAEAAAIVQAYKAKVVAMLSDYFPQEMVVNVGPGATGEAVIDFNPQT